MLLASLTFAVMNIFVKLVSHLPSAEVVFFRSAISLVITFAMIRRRKIRYDGSHKWILFLRGFLGTVALIMFFFTLQKMHLATAIVIHYLSPFFTAMIAALFLGEHLSRHRMFYLLISFVGVLVIHRFDPSVSWEMVAIGVTAALFAGAAYNCVRWLKESLPTLVIMISFPLVATPATLVLILWMGNWVTPAGTDWLYLGLIGVLTQVAQFLLTRAYQTEKAGKVAGVTYSGILYAILAGMFIFNEYLGGWSYVGIALVLLGVILSSLSKR